MTEEIDPGKGSRWVRVDGAVRFIDAPNSRIGLEVDLSLLPWDLFDALGRRVSLIVHADDGPTESPDQIEEHLERALRYVEHAAERTREFAEQEGDAGSDWWRANRTWEWLRSQLLGSVAAGETPSSSSPPAAATGPSAPHRDPGPAPASVAETRTALPPDARAASVLSYMMGALHSIPVGLWEESVTSLHPQAPTREEALRTVTGLIRSLRGEGSATEAKVAPAAPPAVPAAARPVAGGHGPGGEATAPADPDELSRDEARGFDQGYMMGRKVGRALGPSSRRTPGG